MINTCSNHYQFEPSTAQIYCINGVSPKNIDISCKTFSFFSFSPDFCINLNSRVTDKLCICRNTQMFYKSSKQKAISKVAYGFMSYLQFGISHFVLLLFDCEVQSVN